MFFDFERDHGERMVGKNIVLIQERTPFARRESERGVRAGGDVAVLLAEDKFDSRIARCNLFEKRPDVRIRRSIIGDAKLPMFVELSFDRSDGCLDNLPRRIVDGKNY